MMRVKSILLTILVFFFLLGTTIIYAQIPFPVKTEQVHVEGRITIDLYSTLNLNPVTVEIYQPSTVTIRILTPSGTGIPGRSVVIVASGVNITQPTTVTDATGRTTGTVYSTLPGTYLICAKDTTFGYDITIQNCKTLYVVPVAVPTFVPEPYYTRGTTNTVLWNNVGTGYEYYVEVSEDANFNTVLANSGWKSSTSHMFTNLENGKMYFYRVKAKNPYGGVSAWSSVVFSVQDAQPPNIEILSIGDVGDNNTMQWSSDSTVQMVFRVTDNLQLESAIFLCINSKGQAYECTTDYYMEGDNLIVNIRLGDLERVSGVYLREQYEFCVEAKDAAGNITRLCNIKLDIPPGEKGIPEEPSIIERIDKTVEDINEMLDNTIGKLEPIGLERITTTTSIITIGTAFLVAIGSLLNLPYVIVHLIASLLSWLGLRVGAKPLGYVYDALSKEPIPRAIVRIYDAEGRIVWSDVTNPKGYFSARLESGKYRIVVRAHNYTYPSTIIFGKEDYPLMNVYHGEHFELDEDTDLNFAIPLDPKEVSALRIWWEILWGRIKVIVNILHILLFFVGLILAIYVYSRNPYWLTLLVLVLYIPSFLFILRNILVKRDIYATVKDEEGNLVEGIVVGLRELEFEKIIQKRVTDSRGRYRMLVDRGRYRLEVLDTGYQVIHIEGDIEFEVERKEEWVLKDILVREIVKE